jgi:UTP--glucose-1-phosphate uridylyltransferase
VPRSRFVPVKTTNELLAVRSDAFGLAGDGTVRLASSRDGRPPLVELDGDHFRLLRDFEARFAAGPPSLVECERLAVEGDVSFGRDVVVRGSVVVVGPARIEDGAVLGG